MQLSDNVLNTMAILDNAYAEPLGLNALQLIFTLTMQAESGLTL